MNPAKTDRHKERVLQIQKKLTKINRKNPTA
jgi:hypothetical protein